jgi:hypothetical protein|tara:strand:+ start:12593 stop:13462 length:870 start_codon:yes stop_codon:yes gene_type:complete
MIFQRLVGNKLYDVNETNKLGFPTNDAAYIPDQYLDDQEFVIFRTAHGFGDWGILSAMPRLLKQKYPNCRVYIPSEHMMESVYGRKIKTPYHIFKNNPYVDKFIHSADGDVFHDQYRIYDTDNTDIPLVEQMLKFWQFDEHEYIDSQPEMYWTDEEKEMGDYIIKKYAFDKPYATLLISDRFGTKYGKYDEAAFKNDTTKMVESIAEYDLPYFYYSATPLEDTLFNNLDKLLNLRHLNFRIQLYIKSKAVVNIGNQCGTNHMVVRYSEVIDIQRQFPIGHNFINGERLI